MMVFPIKVYENDSCRTLTDAAQLELLAEECRMVFAAGGIVKDGQGRVLMIYRLGYWDFPKGKVEPGEGFETTARREVGEETGLTDVSVVKALPSTFHIYSLNGQRVLKQTYWFLMSADDLSASLIPQEEEDIEEAVWVNADEVESRLSDSYPSLRDLYAKIKSEIL